MPILYVALVLGSAFFGGAIALEYYVAIRQPDRIALDEFRASLPPLLRVMYLSSSSTSIYTRFSDRTAVDYLLVERRRKIWILISWLIHLLIFLGLFGAKASRDMVFHGEPNLTDVLYLCAVVAIHARIAFFGSKIRAGSSVVFSE